VAKSGLGARNTRDTEQWKAAQRIFAEVLELSGPTVNELRSSQLRPRLPTDRYPSDSDWSNAVGELIVKRSQVLKQEWTERFLPTRKADVSCCTFHKKTLRMALRRSVQEASTMPITYRLGRLVGFSNSALVSWVPPTLIESHRWG